MTSGPREFGLDGEASLAAWLGAQATAEGGDPFAHPQQPDAGHRGAARRGLAVVIDADRQSVRTALDPNRRRRGGGMPGDVGERLLNDPVDDPAHRGRHVMFQDATCAHPSPMPARATPSQRRSAGYRTRSTFAAPAASAAAGCRIGGITHCPRRRDDPRWVQRTCSDDIQSQERRSTACPCVTCLPPP
ncbi:hypothetical protein GCM10022419_131680 [Nonomuraea rosea]|uniref:Uncharacterized protein n=1 Tax=Nonomuraea rosea TaxID=638574 RepID=A0ABP7A2L8_9ACTN